MREIPRPRAASPNLSERQQAILAFVRRYVHEHGYPPTFRELGAACGISSTSAVDYNLRVLERQGRLSLTGNIARSIQLTPTSSCSWCACDCCKTCGACAGGIPIQGDVLD